VDGKFYVDNLNDWQVRAGHLAFVSGWVQQHLTVPLGLPSGPSAHWCNILVLLLVQHSTMYLSFMASGLVDLLSHYLGAPPSTELVRGAPARATQQAC
jgi:hypothetical protein